MIEDLRKERKIWARSMPEATPGSLVVDLDESHVGMLQGSETLSTRLGAQSHSPAFGHSSAKSSLPQHATFLHLRRVS